MNKWIGISLGTIVGISHIGMIVMLATRSNLPALNLPVGDYTSYIVEAGKEGYKIEYNANDPLVMEVEKDVDRPAGFLGLGRSKSTFKEQYTMEGSQHLDSGGTEGKLSAAQIECIKAAGGGEQTGAVIGASIGTAAAPAVAGVPFVGPVLAGGIALFAGDQGKQIGGEIAQQLADCEGVE